jgi:hypothetical protein
MSARDLIEPVRAFVSAPRCAVLSTVGADGAPRQIVIHYLLGEEPAEFADQPRVSFRIDVDRVTDYR